MKKTFILLAFTFSIISFAQISYGVKAGYTNSSMKWKEKTINLKFDSRSSFYIGGFLENKISDKLAIQGELQYTQLGGKTTESPTQIVGGEVVEMGTAHIQYINSQIQLPVLAKYYVIPNFSLLGGINVGICLSGKLKTDFVTQDLQNGDLDYYKTISLYPVLGLEYHIHKNIFAEARYNFGLFDASKSYFVNTYFNTFQIGLGYKF